MYRSTRIIRCLISAESASQDDMQALGVNTAAYSISTRNVSEPLAHIDEIEHWSIAPGYADYDMRTRYTKAEETAL
ncbi:hypothetical protein TSAR_003105 [Trichomalopsis sarcophagae]|uniref:Uncharacterized protein n=1 Tax=Trichomalopsis sarcophagae TaxID=543379 RepID=A0A232EMJ5_9HYME|nr:hypothetical protein TSAR_003105 [Trichomalopsis sarcophagae]